MTGLLLFAQNVTEHVEVTEIKFGWVWVWPAIQAIVAAAAAYGGYASQQAQAEAQENAAEQEAMNREAEAERSANQAKQERMNREAESDRERQMAKRRRASMEAGYAKSGVMLDGTPADFLSEQETVDELDIQRGNQASEARAMGYEVNSESLMTSAYNTRNTGKNEAAAMRSGATTSLIGGMVGAGMTGINSYKNTTGSYPSWLGGGNTRKKT